jgi:hypothetical protein
MADSDPSSKAGKLPEWANFTGFIAAISIVAFTTTRLYVVGLGLALRQQLAIYFTPANGRF